ncbi:hypothetical protein QJQ45_023938, partial [Haematococcus lacustris]
KKREPCVAGNMALLQSLVANPWHIRQLSSPCPSIKFHGLVNIKQLCQAVKNSQASEPAPQPATQTPSRDSDIDALEARIRKRKTKRTEAKVKVESAVVDAVTGKGPAPPTAKAETTYLSVMLFSFLLILLEGLVLAGSGFLPEAADVFVEQVLYPSFSPQVAAFLLLSSVYGLWKTGKLDLPFMGGSPPPQP